MVQRFIDTLETDIALLQDAMKNVQSPDVRASLTRLLAELRGAMWVDHTHAGRAAAARSAHPMFTANAVDWF